jgi:hypothetical protein
MRISPAKDATIASSHQFLERAKRQALPWNSSPAAILALDFQPQIHEMNVSVAYAVYRASFQSPHRLTPS